MRTECRVVMSRAQGGLSALDRALSCDCVYVCPVSRHSAGASYFSIVLCYIVSLGKSGRRTAVPPRRCAAGKRAAELLSPLQPSPLRLPRMLHHGPSAIGSAQPRARLSRPEGSAPRSHHMGRPTPLKHQRQLSSGRLLRAMSHATPHPTATSSAILHHEVARLGARCRPGGDLTVLQPRRTQLGPDAQPRRHAWTEHLGHLVIGASGGAPLVWRHHQEARHRQRVQRMR